MFLSLLQVFLCENPAKTGFVDRLSYCITITLYDENENIVGEDKLKLITERFNGYDIGHFYFEQKGIIILTHEARITISKFY